MYKKREIAIITDCHGLKEPLEATLKDIRLRGIEEIYSLGDNIGVGPNPNEVMKLLIANKVKSVAGNAEYYISLGIAPFVSYFDLEKLNNELWTIEQLTKEQIEYIKELPSSIEIELGHQKISLCHFAGDVRTDWLTRGQSRFQLLTEKGQDASKLFEFTNSEDQVNYLRKIVDLYGKGPYAKAITSQLEDPLFKGKRPLEFDCIIQGHTHFAIASNKTSKPIYYTIRANGIGYKNDPIDTASYVILSEKEEGFDVTAHLVKFDRQKMLRSIEDSTIPDKTTIKKYVQY